MIKNITRIRDQLRWGRNLITKDAPEAAQDTSLLQRFTGFQWPPRFIQNWRMAAMLTATLLVVMGIALWLCILIVMTVIGIRRGDLKLSWGRIVRRIRRLSRKTREHT